MALAIGDEQASTGMSKAIYDQLEDSLGAGLAALSPADQEPVRDGWRKLAFAIATGVVNHLLSNLELSGVQAKAPNNVVSTQVAGTGTFA
ncbi:MAG TPA: hypothetical protein VFJ82_09880 [Longimicrobium sp.]|nr:hypothetical protein [Longimicrobium sp.]